MAITRTQIARQLYKDGKRVGLKPGGPPGGGATSMGSGRDFSGGEVTSDSGFSNSGNNNVRDTGSDYGQFDRITERQRKQDLRDLALRQEEDKAFEQQGFETLRVKDNNFPGFIGMGLNALKGPRQKLLDRNIDFFRNDPRTARAREKYGLTAQGYRDYMSARLAGNIDAAGNIINQDDDDNSIIPLMAQAPSNMDQETEVEEPFQRNFRLLADGGMPDDAPVYEGGIMDLESSRQMYGLGKLVKKVTRSVKKIAKSPIGKAALLYFGGNALAGGGLKSFLLGSNAGPSFSKTGLLQKMFLKNPSTGFSLGNLSGTAVAGIPAALSYFMTPEEEEQQAMNYGADIDDPRTIMANPSLYTNRRLAAEGGSMDEPVAKKTMPLLDMDGQEMDLRAEGGFVPIGRMEKADDVPARLSKNEFVFTAEAVRNAGEGDVDKGAEVMYNMMKNLESGGEVSEESQGLEGAREMFQTSQRLEEVI